jgi:hypothetical protein
MNQLLAEGTRGALHTPTWKDLETLQKDLTDIRRQLIGQKKT